MSDAKSSPSTETPQDHWLKLARFLNNHFFKMWLLVLIATAIAAVFVVRLKLQTDLTRLLPKDYKSVKTLNRIIDKLGGYGDFKFLIESSNWEKSVEFSYKFADALRKRDDFRWVQLEREVEFYEKYRLLYLGVDELEKLHKKIKKKVGKEKLKASSLFVDLRTEEEQQKDADSDAEDELEKLEEKYRDYRLEKFFKDKNNEYIVIKSKPALTDVNIKQAKRLLSSLDELWKEVKASGDYPEDLIVHFGGHYKSRVREFDTVLSDVKSSATITGILVLILLTVCFRNLIWVFSLLLSFPMSIVWTFGIVYFAFGSLNIITAFLFVVLFGLGIDFGIHMLSRYLEDRALGDDCVTGLSNMFRQSGRACITACMTTSIAFLILMFTDFKGFSEFGFITGIGIPLALLSMFICLPLMLILVDRYLGKVVKYRQAAVPKNQWIGKKFPFSKGFVTLSILITAAGIYAVTQLEFEYDFSKLRAQDPAAPEMKRKFESVFPRGNSPAIYLTETEEEAKLLSQTLRDYKEKDTETPTIDVVRSVLDYVPTQQKEKIEIIKKLDALITETVINKQKKEANKRRLREIKKSLKVREPMGMSDLPEKIVRQFRDAKGDLAYYTFVYPSVQLVDGKNTIKFADDVARVETDKGVYYSSSQAIIFAEMIKLMIRDGQIAIIATFLMVFILLWIDLKSFKSAAFVLNPLGIGIFSLVIIMKLFDLRINLFNMVAIPSLIGMGIDYGVHLTHRFLENPGRGTPHALRMTGPAVIYSGFTTIVGYIGMVFAQHPGLNSLGKISCLGLFTALIAALFILPSIWQTFGSTKD